MKRYAVFAYGDRANGGMNDFVEAFDSLPDALECVEERQKAGLKSEWEDMQWLLE